MRFALKNAAIGMKAQSRRLRLADIDRSTIALLMVFAIAPPFLSGHFVGEMTRVIIYGMAACGVGFAIRHAGLVSFGNAAFFGMGAYAVLVGRENGLDDARILWPVALGFVGVAALVIGGLSLRTHGVAFIMITLGFAQIVYFVISGNQTVGAADGMPIPTRDRIFELSVEPVLSFYYLTFAILVLTLFVLHRLSRSPAGFALRGVAHDQRRMEALGYATTRLRLAAFMISASVTGLAGILAANYYRFASPIYLHWTLSGEFLVMVALGGAASLSGGLFGALVLIVFEAVLSQYTTYWRIFLGPVIVLSVLYLNQGLHPAFDRLLGKSDA